MRYPASAPDYLISNRGHLPRSFALTINDLGKILSQPSLQIDLGKTEVGNGGGLKRVQDFLSEWPRPHENFQGVGLLQRLSLARAWQFQHGRARSRPGVVVTRADREAIFPTLLRVGTLWFFRILLG